MWNAQGDGRSDTLETGRRSSSARQVFPPLYSAREHIERLTSENIICLRLAIVAQGSKNAFLANQEKQLHKF